MTPLTIVDSCKQKAQYLQLKVKSSVIFLQIGYNCVLIFTILFSRASDYGLMKIDDKGRVLYFNEKPKGAELKSMVQLKITIKCLLF